MPINGSIPASRRRHRFLFLLGLAVAAVLFSVGTAVSYRTHIAAFLIRDAFKSAGFSGVSLHVNRLNAEEISIHDLKTDDGALHIANVQARYNLTGLLRSRINSLSLDGGEATITWDEKGVRLGGMEIQASPDSRLAIPHIERLRADGMTLLLRTPGAALRAPLSVAATAVDQGWDATASGTLEGAGVAVNFRWAGLVTPTDFSQSNGRGHLDVAIENFSLPGTERRLGAHGLLAFEAQNGTFAVGVSRPMTLTLSAGDEGDPRSADDRPWSLTMGSSSSDPVLAITALGERRTIRFDVAATGQSENGQAALALTGSIESTDRRSDIHLDQARADIKDLPFGGGRVSGQIALAEFHGSLDSAKGRIDAALSVEDVAYGQTTIGAASGNLRGAVTFSNGDLHFDLEGVRLNVQRGAARDWELQSPAELTLAPARGSRQSITIGARGAKNRADFAIAVPLVELRSRADPDERVVLRIPDLRLSATSTGSAVNANVTAARAAISHSGAELSEIQFNITAGDGAASGTASARLTRLGAPSSAGTSSSLVTNAKLSTKGRDLVVRGTMAAANGRPLGTYTANVRDDLSQGDLVLSIPEIHVARGEKLEPSDLAFLAPISDLSGFIGLEVKSGWKGSRWSGSARAELRDVSFAVGETSVASLSTTVALSEVWPLRSTGLHQLSVESISAGLPLTALQTSYSFPGDGTITISSASATAAGGRLAVTDAAIPVDARPGLVSLAVEKIDMAQLAAQAKIDGLTLTGSLSGAIPLRKDDDGYYFAGGVLRADGPGILTYAPPAPPAALTENPGGALLLQALSHFAYDRLTITVNGPVSDDISLLVAIAGKNPDLYGGYPIEFNLNLTGRLTQILRQGLVTLPSDLERQIRESKPPG